MMRKVNQGLLFRYLSNQKNQKVGLKKKSKESAGLNFDRDMGQIRVSLIDYGKTVACPLIARPV